MTSIPLVARAAVLEELGKPLVFHSDWPVKKPSELLPGQCLVKIDYTGLCHSDLHVMDGDWITQATPPIVLGHEGVGHIVAIGEHTVDSDVKIGDRVGLKWFGKACLKCEMCSKGYESCCPQSGPNTHGFTIDGTFAEYAVSYVNYVTPIPQGLDSLSATSILCAGLTIYSALKKTKTNVGDWVAIGGAGGGLGHLGVQFAVAMGLRVLAIDTGEEKKEMCLRLGAEKWIDFKTSRDNLVQDVKDATGGEGPQAAVLAIGSPAPFNAAVMYLRPTGTLVALGMPGGSAMINVPIVLLIYKSLTILGSAVGSRQQAIEAMDFAARGKVKVNIRERPLSEINDAIQELRNGSVSGRIGLKVSSDSSQS